MTRIAASWALCAFLVAAILPGEKICIHPTAGASVGISLDEVARAQETLKERLAWSAEEAGKISLDVPYDSGLPACRRHERRVMRLELPAELIGKTIAFAPANRRGQADFHAVTSAARLGDVEADLLADRELTERLGVRCTPTRVRLLSEHELELVENP